MTSPMISRAAIEKSARRCADELVEIVESATRAANRTGNTFTLDRQRVSSMIAGNFSAALAAEGMALVPQTALDWLNGEGPDADGKWFEPPEIAEGERPKPYWWRSKFRAMLKA